MNTLELIKQFVANKGYGVIEEMDRSIVFYYRMARVHAVADLNDEHFCSIILPNFDDVTEENTLLLIVRCNRISADLKGVKCYVTGENILAAVEFYYLNEEDFNMQFEQALLGVSAARDKYDDLAEESETQNDDMELPDPSVDMTEYSEFEDMDDDNTDIEDSEAEEVDDIDGTKDQ